MRYMFFLCMGFCCMTSFRVDAQETKPSEGLMSAGRQEAQVNIRASKKPMPRVMVNGKEGPKPKLLEAITHKKRVYVDAQKRVHVALSAPLYLRVALSPDDNDPNYLLQGPGDSQVAIPFYLDGPGRHHITHPDGRRGDGFSTNVYADGQAPVSTVQLTGGARYTGRTAVYFTKGVQMTMQASDDITGLQTIYITFGDSLYTPYKKSFSFNEEKANRIRYYSVDNVGNSEAVAELSFTIDATSPTIEVRFSGAASSGETPVYATGTTLEMEAHDTLSGLARLVYAINDAPEKPFDTPVRFDTPGDYTVVIRAADNVGNSENQILRFKIN